MTAAAHRPGRAMRSFTALALLAVPATAASLVELTLCPAGHALGLAVGLQGSAAVPFKASASTCFVLGGAGCDKPPSKGCLVEGPCTTAPKWKLSGDNIEIVGAADEGTGICLDFYEHSDRVQAYPCVQSQNQKWVVNSTSGLIYSGWSSSKQSLGLSTDDKCLPPTPGSGPFCAKYHRIHASNVYDPSGPLLTDDGTWHTWEDAGAWSHWVSKDLVHWAGSFTANTTHFGGDTGSVSPTPSGVYAFWPIMGGPGKGAIGSAVSTDAQGLSSWTQRGPTIPMPKRINKGYRDPVRAFEYNDKWWVGVGCGSKEAGAQFCLFEAADDTLSKFTDQGSLYTTNVTFGSTDGNIVWQPTNVSANMMECPDLFPLGDKWVLIGSLYKTNQWWVGTLAGDPPRFTPERVGIVDYGNGYAAKTGSTIIQSGSTRRLVFGFTGWSEPTMPAGCGRALVIPRELSVVGSELMVSPVVETAALRKHATQHQLAPAAHGAALAAGSQVELRVNCTAPAAGWPTNGLLGIRTLATADARYFTEIGYDFAKQAFYADHSHCCAAPNVIVQRAPLPVARLGKTMALSVFVDGGLIEAFLAGRVITPLVAPDPAAGAPAARVSTLVNAIGAACTSSSWQLSL